MKKLTICLLAVSIMLGFASCQKDAETKNNPANNSGNNTEKMEWVVGFYFVHTTGDPKDEDEKITTYYWSLEEAKAAGYAKKDPDWLPNPVFICSNTNFTKIINTDVYERDAETGEFKEPSNSDKAILFADDLNGFKNGGFAFINGKAFIGGHVKWALEDENDNALQKTVYTFDDANNSTLTIYKFNSVVTELED